MRRAGAIGVHSVNRFVYSVPDINEGQRFYDAFGLNTRRIDNRLDLHTFGHPHCWGSLFANGKPKKLQYLSFGIYEEDLDAFARRTAELGAIEPNPLSDGDGVWLRDPDGTPVQIVVAPKVSPSFKTKASLQAQAAPGKGAAPTRSAAARVRPRYLSHILLFTPDVERQVEFYARVLGLRLSDRSPGIVAFLHGAHSSDHHLLAFAKSNAPGFHHSSWDVGSVDEVGRGAEQMRDAGYAQGWGLGRHVLGSNFFHYVRDPWGSFAEYSYDIDFVPADLDWPATDHSPEDSFYVWGPPVPDDFITNFEYSAGADEPHPERQNHATDRV
jgi:catechol 2,3-dioxygenase-like lactoylglutathione lyase family enzyme